MKKAVSGIFIVMVLWTIFIFYSFPVAAQNVAAPAKPVLRLDPGIIDFGILKSKETKSKIFIIRNTGAGRLEWVVNNVDNWLKLDRNSGSVGNNPEIVQVTLNPIGLLPGRYKTKIVVTSTGGMDIITVAATIHETTDRTSSARLKKVIVRSDRSRLHVGEKLYLKAIGEYPDAPNEDITKDVSWVSGKEGVGRFIDKGIMVGESVGSTGVYAKTDNIISSVLVVSVVPSDGPVLQVTPLKIDLGNLEKNTSTDFSLSIKNDGKKVMDWEIVTDRTWLVSKHDVSLESYNKWLKTMGHETISSLESGRLELSPSSRSSYESWKTERDEISSSLSPRATQTINFTAYTVDLLEGNYEGTIFIKSNGGEERVSVSMKIVSLSSMSISPIAIKIRAGQRRTFRAIGIWSDGSRTDLSEHSDGQWIVSDPSIGSFLNKKAVFIAKKTGHVEITKVRGDITSNTALIDVEEFISQPVLFVSPREIDLGAVGPGERSRGTFSLRNVGSQMLEWSSEGLPRWITARTGELSGIMEASPRYIHITVESLKNDDRKTNDRGITEMSQQTHEATEVYPIVITVATIGDSVAFKKYLQSGTYREVLKLNSNGGVRHIFFNFEVTDVEARPRLAIEPMGIDLGIVDTGKKLMKKIKVSNAGKDVLKWKATLQKKRKRFFGITLKRGRYVSLFNRHIQNKDIYVSPKHLKESIFVSGRWSEDDGYPSSIGNNNNLKMTFFGTGIVVFVFKDIEGGVIKATIDDHFVGTFVCEAQNRERAEFVVAEDLREGPHILNLECSKGNVVIEGMRIYGDNLMDGEEGWIRIFPGLGTTSRETDYINVIINTENMEPGRYSENILFASSGGNEHVEVSLEVSDRNSTNIIDIYSYVKGLDLLFTAHPESEDSFLLKGYENKGVDFKLFRKDTHGTTEFYRWYNSEKGDHFYSYDRQGGGVSLTGYQFEGSIANIATSRLKMTKELYRWFNPATGAHFYSTDLKWGGETNNRYKYDGIAGYVR
ncbi:MAG: hypothetical protein JXC33_02840 [Deltaproteobacteria bacterium]|nr:hypothetical protein [Deltaproteobacteria bacterium]